MTTTATKQTAIAYTLTRATPTGWRVRVGAAVYVIDRARDEAWYIASGPYRWLTLGCTRRMAVRRLLTLTTTEH